MRRFASLLLFLLALLHGSDCWAGKDYSKILEHLAKAQRESGTGDFKGAVADFTWLIETWTESPKPDRAHLYSERGGAYLRLNETDNGIKDLSKAIELNPDDLSNYRNRAAAYRKLGKFGLATQDWKTLQDLRNAPKDPAQAETAFLFNAMFEAHRNGNNADTIKLAKELIKRQPKNSMLLLNLGNAQFESGEFTDALSTFNKLIKLNPNDRYAYNYCAIIHAKFGDNRQAIEEFSKVLELRKKFPMTRFDSAISSYAGRFMAPDSSEIYCTRAKLYLQEKQPNKALADCSEALKLNPKDDEARLVRAATYSSLKRYDKAKADYETILSINPKDEEAAKKLAELHLRLEQYAQAAKLASRAIELDGDDWRTYLIRASAYDKMSKFRLADEDRRASQKIKGNQ